MFSVVSRRTLLAAGVASAALLAAALPASAQTVDAIKAKGKVTVGMLVDFPPFGITDTAGKPDGYDADVAKLLAKEMGVPVEIVPVTGPNRIPYLQTNKVDLLVASLGITAERAKQVQFSSPYAAIQIGVMAPATVAIKTPADLAGKRISVTRAATQDVAVTAVAPKEATLMRFDDDASAVQALLSGQVDAIGISNVVGQQIRAMAPQANYEMKFVLSRQVQGIAMRQGQDDLLKWVDAFVAKIKADGSLNAIHRKWLGSDLPDLSKP